MTVIWKRRVILCSMWCSSVASSIFISKWNDMRLQSFYRFNREQRLKIPTVLAHKPSVKTVPGLLVNDLKHGVARMDIGRRQDVIHHSWHGYMSTVNGGQLLIEQQHIVVCPESIFLGVGKVGSTIKKVVKSGTISDIIHFAHSLSSLTLTDLWNCIFMIDGLF